MTMLNVSPYLWIRETDACHDNVECWTQPAGIKANPLGDWLPEGPLHVTTYGFTHIYRETSFVKKGPDVGLWYTKH